MVRLFQAQVAELFRFLPLGGLLSRLAEIRRPVPGVGGTLQEEQLLPQRRSDCGDPPDVEDRIGQGVESGEHERGDADLDELLIERS